MWCPKNEDPNIKKDDPDMTGTLPTHGRSQPLRRGQGQRNDGINDIKPQPDQAAIPHMEHVNARWQRIKTEKHPEITVEAALFHYPYDQTVLKAPNKLGRGTE